MSQVLTKIYSAYTIKVSIWIFNVPSYCVHYRESHPADKVVICIEVSDVMQHEHPVPLISQQNC